MKNNPFSIPNDIALNGKLSIEKLEFKIDDLIEENIHDIKQWYLNQLSSLSCQHLWIDTFGRNDCKEVGVSPDAVMQLIIQMAHHRLYGYFASAYEPCSTAMFKHGRTECIRPLTMEMRELVEQMNSFRNQISYSARMELLKKCSEKHVELTKSAISGTILSLSNKIT